MKKMCLIQAQNFKDVDFTLVDKNVFDWITKDNSKKIPEYIKDVLDKNILESESEDFEEISSSGNIKKQKAGFITGYGKYETFYNIKELQDYMTKNEISLEETYEYLSGNS